jgi:hypothetical protein
MAVDNAAPTLTKLPKPGKKYFSLEEATRSLPYVSRIVRDLVAGYKRVIDVRAQLERAQIEEIKERIEIEYDAAMDALRVFVEELNQVGVELKDPGKGLIDFPALFQHREVYLCWKLGETSVDSWHEIDAGYAGRQSISELKGI